MGELVRGFFECEVEQADITGLLHNYFESNWFSSNWAMTFVDFHCLTVFLEMMDLMSITLGRHLSKYLIKFFWNPPLIKGWIHWLQ